MGDVDAELLPDHPIDMLRAAETDQDAGYVRGECLAYLCRECGNVDEDVGEIIHEEDCSLANETYPTGYDQRLNTDQGRVADIEELRADGGE